MTKWNKVLSNPVNTSAIYMFSTGELNCENVQKVFRALPDREAAGQVRGLIRQHGTQLARRISRKALRRRNLMD
jgi:hypothetical protein